MNERIPFSLKQPFSMSAPLFLPTQLGDETDINVVFQIMRVKYDIHIKRDNLCPTSSSKQIVGDKMCRRHLGCGVVASITYATVIITFHICYIIHVVVVTCYLSPNKILIFIEYLST